MSLEDDAKQALLALAEADRLRTPRVIDSPAGAMVVVDGRRCLNLSSNDYLGLANDPRLIEVGREVLAHAGVGSSASRLVVGNHREHVALEDAIQAWFGVSGARTFTSGYAANVGTISALVARDDVVFSDALNHASLIDGCRLSRARVLVYSHGDLDALEALLRTTPVVGRRFLVSETVFSMDGDVCDVRGLARLAQAFDAALVLDEAHAVGAYGPQGRGIAAMHGIVPDVLVGTFGKALGTSGAFVATSRAVADLLWNRARSLVFSTGGLPALSAMSRASIALVRGDEGDERRAALAHRIETFRRALDVAGETAIVPWLLGDDARTMALTESLLVKGVFAQGIRPPTVPRGTSRLRLSLSASHEPHDLVAAASLLR